ncbi:MAG: LytTR family transcriptional regulator [Ruminococcus sp.]|jgi:DNA-binding LytR/AlgR family response regulator|nr:LytTR family transcriptional regulator [Ruminococcus sp.]
MDEEKIWNKVWLTDVYYFETIKSTHYCEVSTKNGTGKLHADIINLEKYLPKHFFKTRASTIVNLELIQRIDMERRMLYFAEQVFCTYAMNKTKEIKTLLRLHHYRNYKGESHGQGADITL